MSSAPEPQVQISLRPLASALPLGFFAFGIGMALLASLDAGWIDLTEGKHVGMLLASFVFPLELVAAIFGFLSRDVFAGTGLGLFSSSWLAVGVALMTAPQPGAKSAALGIYLLAFSAAIVPLAMTAFLGKPLIGAIMLTATARAVLSGIFELGGGHSLESAAGVLAAVVAGLAWYGGTAFLLEDMMQRPVLPTFRRGAARNSLEGTLDEQINRARADAGVRQQL